MNRHETFLRVVTVDDAEELLKIYAPYVEETAITFECAVPDVTEFRRRIEKTTEKYPYIVAVAEGEICGFAYTSMFAQRSAYDWAAQTSIYVKCGLTKIGYGKMLYAALEKISKAQHIQNLNACIAYSETEDEYLTKNSAEFHAHQGYRLVGRFHQCANKFGRWYDMIWMEKMLGAHEETPRPVIPFPLLSKDILAACGLMICD